MAPSSMTGYSRVTTPAPHGTVTVELRSINHRFLELETRLPDGWSGCEAELTQAIKRSLRRGRVDVTVSLQRASVRARRHVIDATLAQACYESLLELKGRFGLKGAIALEHVLAHPRIFSVEEPRESREQHENAWRAAARALQQALQVLVKARQREGTRLAADIHAQARGIERHLSAIRRGLPGVMARQRRRLGERVKITLGRRAVIAPAQLREAVAILKDTDIHEELVRMDSHLTHLRQTLAQTGPAGKTLDFIAQELTRETNTLGAKANDAAIAKHVVEIKGAIERIREQGQNLE